MTERRSTGRIALERIGGPVPPLAAEVIARFTAFVDLASTISDVLDELGIVGAIPAAVLAPAVPGIRLVGRAITVENRLRTDPLSIEERALARDNRLADVEAHNLAQPGDVLVVQGVDGISSMGRVSAALGRRQGEVGAIVDGAVRDLAAARELAYPIWSRPPSPLTGKHRLETVAINRSIVVAGVRVVPGDLVLADESGVVFVPNAAAARVLERAERAARSDRSKLEAIARGVAVPDLPGVRHE